jgi:hypothetical protein
VGRRQRGRARPSRRGRRGGGGHAAVVERRARPPAPAGGQARGVREAHVPDRGRGRQPDRRRPAEGRRSP